MRAYNTRHIVVSALLAVVWAAMPAMAETTMHARISYESGGAMVQGTADADWSYATTNTLILPGDQLWADKGGTMELEMSGGSFLRMADGSKAEIIELPPSASIRAWTGAFYVQRIARSTGDFLFITPACRVEITPESHVRIDVLDEGSTTITVRWGEVVIRTDVGAPLKVSTGKRVFVDPGYLPSAPVVFDRNMEDDFDAWSRERAESLAKGYDAIPTKVIETPVVGAASLASHGDWVYVDSSYYWRPTTVVNYVPYRHGYWSYVPAYGYCWVDDYPFAYVTSHYGRWTYHGSYGWLWAYRPTWGPAWVASVRYGNNFVWAPLSPYDRHVIYGDLHYTVGGVRFSMYASSYCVADRLLYGPSYVDACYPGIIHNGRYGDVNIWNININNGTTGRWYSEGSGLRVRDYSPRRVIRGPDTIGPRSITASARSAQLQSSFTRSSFSPVDRTGGRMLRTPMTESSRNARLRSVAVDRSASPTTSAAIHSARGDRVAPTGSDSDRTVRSARTAPDTGAAGVSRGDSRTMRTPSNTPGVNIPRTAPSTSSAIPASPRTRVVDSNTSTTTRGSASTQTPTSRTTRSTTPPSTEPGNRARTVTDAHRPAQTPQRTAPPSRSISSGRGSVSESPRSSATSSPSSRSRSVSVPRSTAPSSSSSSVRTPVRSAPTSRSITSRAPSTSSSSSSRSRSISVPRSTAPSSSSSSVRTPAPSAPRSIPRSAPSVSSSSRSYRSVPSASSPSRSSSSYRAPSVPRSAPSAVRSAPSPSRSMPSVSRPAPSVRSSAPSTSRPSISAPSSRSSSGRSFSAPSRSAPSASRSSRGR